MLFHIDKGLVFFLWRTGFYVDKRKHLLCIAFKSNLRRFKGCAEEALCIIQILLNAIAGKVHVAQIIGADFVTFVQTVGIVLSGLVDPAQLFGNLPQRSVNIDPCAPLFGPQEQGIGLFIVFRGNIGHFKVHVPQQPGSVPVAQTVGGFQINQAVLLHAG